MNRAENAPEPPKMRGVTTHTAGGRLLRGQALECYRRAFYHGGTGIGYKRCLLRATALLDGGDQLGTVIRIDSAGFLGARQPHVEAFLVDQMRGSAFGVDEGALGAAPLGREGRCHIAMRNMLVARVIEHQRLNLAPGQPDRGAARAGINGGNLGLLAVNPPQGTVIAGELNLISCPQLDRLGGEGLRLHRPPLPQPPVDRPAGLIGQQDCRLTGVDAGHPVGLRL